MPSFTRPTKFPEWASGGSAAITEPTAGEKSAGWVNLQKPPHQFFNWWQKLVYDWFQYLDVKDPQAFTSVYNALVDMSDDEIGIIDEHNPATDWLLTAPWVKTVAAVAVPVNLHAVCTDGQYVYLSYKTSGVEYLECYDTDGTQIFKLTPAYSIDHMSCDGAFLWVVNGADLYKYTRLGVDTGVTKFTHNASITSVDSTGKYVWIAGADAASFDVQVIDATSSPLAYDQRYNLSATATAWKVQGRGNSGYAQCTNAAANDLFKLNAATGATDAQVNCGEAENMVLLNDSILIIYDDGPGTRKIQHRNLVSLSALTTPTGVLADTANAVNTLAYDGAYLAIEQNDVMYFYRADSLAYVAGYALAGTPVQKLLTANALSFFLFMRDSTNFTLTKQRSKKRAVTVRKCLGTDGYREPFSQLLIPVPQ